jgi:P4 family phage/plasmid primase-like protien
MGTIPKEVMQFKKFFHQNKPVHFLAVCKDDSGKTKSRQLVGPLKTCWSQLQKLNEDGWNAYMAVNTIEGEKRTSEKVTQVNALFIDYDGGKWSASNLEKFLSKFPVRPHLVVETSPGCYHVYWPVGDVPLDKFKIVQQKLAAKFGADPKVCDLPRVMRMPSTINWNHGEPFVAHIVHLDEGAKPMAFSKFGRAMLGSPSAAEPIGNTRKTTPVVAATNHVSDSERVERALKEILADDRQVWVTVGMALKSEFGDSGLPLFKTWSSKSAKYDEAELERQWLSFRPEGNVKIGTLFYLAKLHRSKTVINKKNSVIPSNMLQLAKHFAVSAKDVLRYCEAENAWYVFKNGVWEKSLRSAERIAIGFLEALLACAIEANDSKFLAFIKGKQSVKRAKELMNYAASDPVLSISEDAFDQSPKLLGAKLPAITGGIDRYVVINLESKKYSYSLPEHMLRSVVGVVYDPSAFSPLWNSFLEQVTAGDMELIEFLQMAVGYTMFGHTKEQVMFIVIGGSGTGKGVFIRTIRKLLGNYATVLQSSLLKAGAIGGNSPSPALMKLKGKRLWWCSEIPKGMAIDEGLTKQITGGDIVSGRGLFVDQAEFPPVGKLWFTVNDMPRVRYDDDGMWRRIIGIPFNVSFRGKKCDRDLEDKLLVELPGIFNWALEGARKYAEKGMLVRPRASRELLAKLKHDVDTVGIWINSCCIMAEDAKLQSKIAYDSYIESMKREKANPLPQKEFKADLERRGHIVKSGNKFNYFPGLKIKS